MASGAAGCGCRAEGAVRRRSPEAATSRALPQPGLLRRMRTRRSSSVEAQDRFLGCEGRHSHRLRILHLLLDRLEIPVLERPQRDVHLGDPAADLARVWDTVWERRLTD